MHRKSYPSIVLGVTLLGLIIFALMSWNVSGETIVVDGQGGGNYTSIQQAIDNSTDGDTIQVWAGTYQENIVVNRSISLLGNGTNETIIENVDEDTSVSLMVSSNNVQIGGMVFSNERPYPLDAACRISTNHSTFRDLYFSNTSLHIEHTGHSIFTKNKQSFSGGSDGYFSLKSSSNNVISNSIFIDTGDFGNFFSMFNSSNTIIMGNEFHTPRTAIYITSGFRSSEYPDPISHNNSIIDNHLRNIPQGHGLFGIDLQHSRHTRIEGNEIGGFPYAMQIFKSDDTRIERNSFFDSWFNRCIIVGNSSGVYILNNDFSEKCSEIHFNPSCEYVEIHNNRFFRQSDHYSFHDIQNDGNATVNATENWWGHPSGPYQQHQNPDGKGVGVGDNILFSPWLDEQGNLVYLKDPEEDANPLSLVFLLINLLVFSACLVIVVRMPDSDFSLVPQNSHQRKDP